MTIRFAVNIANRLAIAFASGMAIRNRASGTKNFIMGA